MLCLKYHLENNFLIWDWWLCLIYHYYYYYFLWKVYYYFFIWKNLPLLFLWKDYYYLFYMKNPSLLLLLFLWKVFFLLPLFAIICFFKFCKHKLLKKLNVKYPHQFPSPIWNGLKQRSSYLLISTGKWGILSISRPPSVSSHLGVKSQGLLPDVEGLKYNSMLHCLFLQTFRSSTQSILQIYTQSTSFSKLKSFFSTICTALSVVAFVISIPNVQMITIL